MQTRAARAALTWSLALLAFACTCARPAAARQVGPAPDKTASVKSLLEASAARLRSAEVFEELLGRYQKNWPDAVIEGYRSKRLFEGLTPGETAQMEALIREFSDRMFKGIKTRVVGELLTEESFVSLCAPVFEKYLDAGEMSRLAVFARTPAGRKLIDLTFKNLREAVVAALDEREFFKVSPSPEEDEAKLDRLQAEMRGGGVFAEVQRTLLKRAPGVAAEFTPEEQRELVAFSQTPLGSKVSGVWLPLSAELLQRNAALFAPRAGEIAGQVMEEQMEFFKERTAEILKNAGPRRRAKRPARN
ncbi:MAG: hypothetical protein ABR603_09120 [Pyrinomonadaceae bacterium]